MFLYFFLKPLLFDYKCAEFWCAGLSAQLVTLMHIPRALPWTDNVLGFQPNCTGFFSRSF